MPLPLAVTPGDPLGVGPEVACKALARRAERGRSTPAVLVGDGVAIGAWAERVGLTLEPVAALGPVLEGTTGLLDTCGASEPAEVAAIRASVAAALEGRARALVTGPIHKARLAARGFPHPGHTDFLGVLCGVERPVMAFVGGAVRVALVTVHVPLGAVAGQISTDGVLHAIRTADTALRDRLGLGAPRLAVCGLNPHAGDGGLLGDEEADHIAPAVLEAQRRGVDARGPVSAEAAFGAAVRGEVDLVVAMYHDQGLVPLKALHAWRGEDDGAPVNWTLGLPIVRTSVDHGTADDIAGRGVADPGSMEAALALAERLTAAGTTPAGSRSRPARSARSSAADR